MTTPSTMSLSVKGSALRLKIHVIVYAEFNAHITGVQAGNLQANIVNYASNVDET